MICYILFKQRIMEFDVIWLYLVHPINTNTVNLNDGSVLSDYIIQTGFDITKVGWTATDGSAPSLWVYDGRCVFDITRM